MQDDPPLRDDWNRCMICGQLAWDGFDFDWDGSTRRLGVTEFGEYVEKCKMLAETLSGQPVPDPRQHK